jgi:hypothetical protein
LSSTHWPSASQKVVSLSEQSPPIGRGVLQKPSRHVAPMAHGELVLQASPGAPPIAHIPVVVMHSAMQREGKRENELRSERQSSG